jgi:hypothetical protein
VRGAAEKVEVAIACSQHSPRHDGYGEDVGVADVQDIASEEPKEMLVETGVVVVG